MDNAEGTVTSYTFKPSLAGGVRQFELTDAGLAWQIGPRRGTWPYRSIATVRLSFRPASMRPRQFRADIVQDTGQRLVVLSTSWKGMTLAEAQDDAYRRFVLALHRRIAESGGNTVFHGGLRPLLYGLAVVVLIPLAVAMLALMARAITTGAIAGILFLLAVAAVFVWQIGDFMRRNKPRLYMPDEPPPQLLP